MWDDILKEYFAHSGKPEYGVLPQTYADHIHNVVKIYDRRSAMVLKFYSGKVPRDALFLVGRDAAVFHDLGKLLEDCQEVLRGDRQGRMINHVDAGVAFLRDLYLKCVITWKQQNKPFNHRFLIAAIIVHGHHIGLLNSDKEPEINPSFVYDPAFMRDASPLTKYPHLQNADPSETVMGCVDKRLKALRDIHFRLVGKDFSMQGNGHLVHVPCLNVEYDDAYFTALTLRMISSMVYFADHTDTARSQGGVALDDTAPELPLRAKERIRHLDQEHTRIFGNKTGKRNSARKRLFTDASTHPVTNSSHKFYVIDASVGSGKTIAGLKFALRLADAIDARGIITFAPYISLIDQLVEQYEKFALLPDEQHLDKTEVIARNHHLAEFGVGSTPDRRIQLLKSLSSNWFSPIVVSSVEQLIGTLATNVVPVIKKLHNLAGRVILIEEFHNVPLPLWGWFLYILRQLVDYWGCRVVFVSGSPIKFWEMDGINQFFGKHEVRRVVSANTSRSLSMSEHHRVRYRLYNNGRPTHYSRVIGAILQQKGSVLVVCSTTQNAAVVAQLCANKIGWDNVYHISTALTPNDRAIQMEEIRARLADKSEERKNFILVGTSCIESGLDFSFDAGFIEARSVAATEQAGGRVNRESIRIGMMYVFCFADSAWITRLTQNQVHEAILISLMRKREQLRKSDVHESVEEAIAFSNNQIKSDVADVVLAERQFAMRKIREEIQMIAPFGVLMLNNPKLVELLNYADPLHDEGALDTAHEYLGLDRSKRVRVGWINAMIQKHSFKINIDGEQELQRRGLPYHDLANLWGDFEEDDVLSKMREDRLFFWGGAYDDRRLGYMNHVLSWIGVPGVVPAAHPAAHLKGLL